MRGEGVWGGERGGGELVILSSHPQHSHTYKISLLISAKGKFSRMVQISAS